MTNVITPSVILVHSRRYSIRYFRPGHIRGLCRRNIDKEDRRGQQDKSYAEEGAEMRDGSSSVKTMKTITRSPMDFVHAEGNLGKSDHTHSQGNMQND